MIEVYLFSLCAMVILTLCVKESTFEDIQSKKYGQKFMFI